MRPEADWDRLIGGLRRGDDEVLTEFYQDWGKALERVADRHIAEGLRRRFGAESVVQSACRSFLRRARDDAFELHDSEDLWRLLCAITLTKVREQARYHTRGKRGVLQEVTNSNNDQPGPDPVDSGPLPGEALALAEQFDHVLASFTEEERRIVDLKLAEKSNAEVATELECSERTVRRLLGQLRTRLEGAFVD